MQHIVKRIHDLCVSLVAWAMSGATPIIFGGLAYLGFSAICFMGLPIVALFAGQLDLTRAVTAAATTASLAFILFALVVLLSRLTRGNAALKDTRAAHVRRFLDISTEHLKPETWQAIADAIKFRSDHSRHMWTEVVALSPGAVRLPVSFLNEYGAILYVPSDIDDIDTRWPHEIQLILLTGSELGCDYVLLDRDADPLPGLPLFDQTTGLMQAIDEETV